MLVLSRKLHDAVRIGDDIRIQVIDVDRGKIRLALDAPRDVPIFREELLDPKTFRPSAVGNRCSEKLCRALDALNRIASMESPEGSMARAVLAEIA